MPKNPILFFNDKDTIFQKTEFPKPFCFTKEVAGVFDDMIARSVPLYHEVLKMTVQWATRHYQPDTTIYDIGVSTGTTLSLLTQSLPNARLIGIDNSQAMLDKAREKLKPFLGTRSIKLINDDARHHQYQHGSVVIANYTLQFIPVEDRVKLIKKIAGQMPPQGIFILSEKVKSPSDSIQESMTHFYEEFKTASGYTRQEIAQKKEALENVLVSFTENAYRLLLTELGYSICETVLRWNQFSTMIAIKGK